MINKVQILKEECPNCKHPDESIKPMKDGSCGACGGKGYIIWKEAGNIADYKLINKLK